MVDLLFAPECVLLVVLREGGRGLAGWADECVRGREGGRDQLREGTMHDEIDTPHDDITSNMMGHRFLRRAYKEADS